MFRQQSPPASALAAFVSALLWCGGVAPIHAQALFDRRPVVIAEPQPDRFSVCFGHSCSVVVTVGVSTDDWQMVRALFREPAASPEAERVRIATAIAAMESVVGALTGTWRDYGGDVKGFARPGQMDCVDEANNSTTYLRMFARDGLLQWHSVGPIMKRGHLLWGIPHATAVIIDISTAEWWAVDSWFQDNGMPPYIVPYVTWQDGWRPPKE
jgi:hypothetical protein